MDVSFVKWTAPYLGRDLAVITGLILFALPSIFVLSYAFYLFVDAPAVQISHWFYFAIGKSCLKLKKRPQPIRRKIWISLLAVFLISIIISSIPSRQGNARCDNHSTGNITLPAFDR